MWLDGLLLIVHSQIKHFDQNIWIRIQSPRLTLKKDAPYKVCEKVVIEKST